MFKPRKYTIDPKNPPGPKSDGKVREYMRLHPGISRQCAWNIVRGKGQRMTPKTESAK